MKMEKAQHLRAVRGLHTFRLSAPSCLQAWKGLPGSLSNPRLGSSLF